MERSRLLSLPPGFLIYFTAKRKATLANPLFSAITPGEVLPKFFLP